MYICVQKQCVSLSYNFMGKLQLYITIAYNGYREMLEINSDSNVKAHVRDMSHLMGKIKYKPGRMSIFFMLKYTHDGVFITALRTIPVQKPDHLAAWVFIPYDIKISTPEIEDVMEVVIKAISNSKITSETYSELCKIFEKDYDNIPYAPAVAPNYGTETAYRYYGDVTGYILSDLIGTKRYQTSYLPYSEVVLADKAIVSDIDGHALTDEPLDQMVKLSPPGSPDPSFSPMIFECEFDKPYLAPLMGTVEIRWMKENNVAAVQSVMVNRPNMRPDSLSLEELHATSSGSKETESEKQRIAPPNLSHHYFDESPHPQTETAEYDYESFQPDTVDNTNSTAGQHHKPTTEPHIEKPTKTLEDKEGSIMSSIASLFDKKNNDKNFRLPGSDSHTKLTWALIGFVAGVLLTLLGTCIHHHVSPTDSTANSLSADSLSSVMPVETVDIPQTTEKRSTTTKAKEETQKSDEAQKSIDAAINYLEGYKTWTKQDLDKYPDLAGLYDDMNNFRLQRIVNHWGPKLKKSARFSKIVTHAKQAIKRGKKPRVPEGQTTFNTKGKQSIYIMTYLNTIDP